MNKMLIRELATAMLFLLVMVLLILLCGLIGR